DTHSEELKRGITIRLGYADASFYKCPDCEEPQCYSTRETCPRCSGKTQFLRRVSFIDAPGHESLMATMLSGANIMDGAVLLVSATEECPQPQTREHLMALQIIGIKDVVVVQNKVDLVSENKSKENYQQIKKFLKDTPFKDIPIIPVSAQHGANIDILIWAFETYLKTPVRNPKEDSLMYVARSFDVNKPGDDPCSINGGVLGGSMVDGRIQLHDQIEIRPGRKVEKDGRTDYIPLTTTVAGLITGNIHVEEITPGGSVGVMTMLDPAIVKSDQLGGSVVGHPGKLPPTLREFALDVHLLDRVVGLKEELTVEPIKLKEMLMITVHTASTVGVVSQLGKGKINCILKLPVCAHVGDRVTISRRVANRFRLIGYGIIRDKF
ncbi:translation initiation factor IF-2 subunit gamma, partial [Candidatus Woesearchaeota archaeon CG_4_10_14_0_8_um_filter_47_5]